MHHLRQVIKPDEEDDNECNGVGDFESENIKQGVRARSNGLKVLMVGVERTRLLGNTPHRSPALYKQLIPMGLMLPQY